MLATFTPNHFLFTAGSFTGRLSGAEGVSLTPTSSYSTWFEIIADSLITEDCYGLFIAVRANGGGGSNKLLAINVGVDSAGGTSYVTIIPDLLFGNAVDVHYYFPIYIKAGSAVAIQTNCSHGSNIQCAMQVYGKPTAPETIAWGSKVIAYGVTGRAGVAVTAGTAAEGSYTEIGTVGSDDRPFWWQYGVNVTDTTMVSDRIGVDLAIGDGSNFRQITNNSLILTDTSENVTRHANMMNQGYGPAAPGEKLYARMQYANGTADTGWSIAMYGLV